MFSETDFVRFSIEVEGWGRLDFLRFIPEWDPLDVMEGTPWKDVFCRVSGNSLSMALYGRHMTLVRELGLSPEDWAKRLPLNEVRCSDFQDCMIASESCKPGPGLPECYRAPGKTLEQSRIGSVLGKAIRDGRYVIVVGEGEFVV